MTRRHAASTLASSKNSDALKFLVVDEVAFARDRLPQDNRAQTLFAPDSPLYFFFFADFLGFVG